MVQKQLQRINVALTISRSANPTESHIKRGTVNLTGKRETENPGARSVGP